MGMEFPIDRVRGEFPILNQLIYDKPLVYFDNAASTQKPRQVIDAIAGYYERDNCNIHRGVHYLSVKATEGYEQVRNRVKSFIHARSSSEVVFTKGATESINLVASSFGKRFLKEGDEVIVTIMEHHSNFVPWQQVCLTTGAKLKVAGMNALGELDVEGLKLMVNERTKMIALTHISNVLGTINPIKSIIDFAHRNDIPVLVDGAQGISHLPIDVQELDCDFYCFSGHKMYAPMGVGIVYGKERWLEALPPYQMGGEMIRDVYIDHTTFNDLPFKFEAGTPNVEGVMGLGSAIDYLDGLGMRNIAAYEEYLLHHATKKMSVIEGLKIVGRAKEKASVISFLVGDIHPYDVGTILDKLGIAVRTGHHCAMPLIDHLKIPGTVRASFAFYNTTDEIDRLVEAILRVKKMFE